MPPAPTLPRPIHHIVAALESENGMEVTKSQTSELWEGVFSPTRVGSSGDAQG